MTEGRLLPRCGAFGPLKNLLPLAPSVHCLGRRYETPNALIKWLEQQQIFRQIPHPAPIAHIHCLPSGFVSLIPLSVSPQFHDIEEFHLIGMASERGNGLSRRGEGEGFDGMAAQRRWAALRIEANALSDPLARSICLSLGEVFLLLRKPFEPSQSERERRGQIPFRRL